MKASVVLDHGMTFVGTANSGFPVTMGTDPSVGGDDDGLRPMELLLIGLGGCTAMDVVSILRKKRQDIVGMEVKLEAERPGTQPNIFSHITINYIVRGHSVDPKAVKRAIELSETKYCSAQAMMAEAATIEHKFEIIEES